MNYKKHFLYMLGLQIPEKSAFTLSEMMVLMLIMSIALAASAPIMTTRMTKKQTVTTSVSKVWEWINTGNDAYFGGSGNNAIIGDTEAGLANSKLIIKTSEDIKNHIAFNNLKINEDDGTKIITHLAKLRSGNNSIIFNNYSNNDIIEDQENTVAIGIGAAEKYENSNGSIAIGYSALKYNKQTAENKPNIAIGYNALRGPEEDPNTYERSNTIAIGDYAMADSKNTTDNIAIGSGVMQKNDSGSNNIAIGGSTLSNSTSATKYNIVIGKGFPNSGNLGEHNIAMGYNALNGNNSLLSNNIAIGYQTLSHGSDKNIAIGTNSMSSAVDNNSNNVAIGDNAMKYMKCKWKYGGNECYNDIITNHVAIGRNAFNHPGTGDFEIYQPEDTGIVVIGHDSIQKNLYTQGITVIGNNIGATSKIPEFTNSVHIGNSSGDRLTYANDNVFVGYSAGGGLYSDSYTKKNNYLTAIGFQAINYKSAYVNEKETKTANNTGIGINTCSGIDSKNKTCIGQNSNLKYEYFEQTGSNKYYAYDTGAGSLYYSENWKSVDDNVERIFIGSKPDAYNNSRLKGTSEYDYLNRGNHYGTAVLEIHNPRIGNTISQNIRTGNFSKETINNVNNATNNWFPTVVINGNLIVRGRTQLASAATTATLITDYSNNTGENIAITDDRNFTRYSDARLKNTGRENSSGLEKIKQLKVFNYTFKTDENKTPRVGIIAQNLQKVFPDAVTKDKNGYLQIRMEDMFYAMINAVKKLDTKIANLIDKAKQNQTRIKILLEENQTLKEENQILEKRLEVIKAKLES